MARTIQEIKNKITSNYISNYEIQKSYGLIVDKSFDEQFSKVSIESILFYIVAVGIWTLEVLFDYHKQDMEQLIDTKKPHRLKWYRDKALEFQYGQALVENSNIDDQVLMVDSDLYNNEGLTDDEIAKLRVVKYAAAVEQGQGTRILIKVAGGNEIREKLTPDQELKLTAYFKEVRDAGVKLEITNKEAIAFKASLRVHYDPMVLDFNGNNTKEGGDEPVRSTIVKYLNNLPFNAEYNNMALVDQIQLVPGVKIAVLEKSYHKTIVKQEENETEKNKGWHLIEDKHTPDSGYFKIYDATDLTIEYIAHGIVQY